jgi:demethylmacrocin O-methyltransferase
MTGQHKTDKYISGLAEYYKKYLAPYKDLPLKVLEVGVQYGGSLFLLKELLPNAQIFGIDHAAYESIPKGTTFECIDQNNLEGLRAFAKKHGPFDIVIDDGAHRYQEILNTYEAFYPSVNPGGIYFVEDWSVCYFPAYRDSNAHIRNKEFVHMLIEKMNDEIETFDLIHNRLGSYSLITIKKCKTLS